jgi:hypothetical protein
MVIDDLSALRIVLSGKLLIVLVERLVDFPQLHILVVRDPRSHHVGKRPLRLPFNFSDFFFNCLNRGRFKAFNGFAVENVLNLLPGIFRNMVERPILAEIG